MKIILLSVDMSEPEFVVCHKCKYTKTKYRATRHNIYGSKKYYQCEKCASYTTPDDGFWKMKNLGEFVSAAIELYNIGVSLRETADVLHRLFGIKTSRMSILRWIRKYSKYVKKFTNMKRPELSGQWSVDEKFVKVKGKKGYIWLVKDKKRGFVISYVLSDNRKAKNAGKLFRRSKKIGKPKSINRDKYAGYPKQVRKYFPDAYDNVSKGFWHKHNNNSIESTNGEFNQRHKTMRGFGSFDSADKIIDGWITHHNFVKKNRKTKKTNAERVGIKEVPETMPWLWMIKSSAQIKNLLSAKF